MRFWYLFLSIVAAVFVLPSCQREEHTSTQSLISGGYQGLDAFIPVYNQYIAQWLDEQIAKKQNQIRELEEKIAKNQAEKKAFSQLQEQLEDSNTALRSLEARKQLGNYFAFKTPQDIPNDLVWQDGMDEPEIGDPQAQKGGTLNNFILTFPPTLRRFGPESAQSFRGYAYDEIEIPLVNLHPITNQFIPGIAHQWALSADGKTMFYRIDPDAKFSNDDPILAKDFMMGAYVRISDNVVEPFYSQYLREEIANITVYDERTLSITLPQPKPLMPLYAAVYPASPKFYQEYGPDFKERYNWKHEPTSGAYFIQPEDIQKGQAIALTRKKDWWAKDKKYYKHMFNVDRIHFTLVRNISKALEMFNAGQIDYFNLTPPDYWYRKSEIPQVFNGYIERYTFYNQYPRPPFGFYLNVRQPLVDQLEIRRGIAYACNWQRVIDVLFQGDYARMQNFSEGFGPFTNPDVKALPFSISKARECFAKAGFTKEGADGILRNQHGVRLSIPINTRADPEILRRLSIIQEEAKKAGLELRLDALEPTTAFKKQKDKRHSIAFTAYAVTPPFPRYFDFLHSSNAVNEDGSIKTDTNNLFGYANPRTDKLSTTIRRATNLETIRKASHECQQIMIDEAIFIPAYSQDFVRMGCWRWLRWPNTKNVPLTVPVVFEPLESHLFWIDPSYKKETLEAMSSSPQKKFPEVQRTIDQFRSWQAPLTRELPRPAGSQPLDAQP